MLSAQTYRIAVELNNYQEDTIYLGCYLMNKQYYQDTAVIDKKGEFIFERDTAFPAGLYLVILPPKNDLIQLIVNRDHQSSSVKADFTDLKQSVRYRGDDAKDNELLNEYGNRLLALRPKMDSLGQLSQSLAENSEERKRVEEEMAQIRKEVVDFQEEIITEYPKSFTAAVILADRNVEEPTFTGEDLQMKRYLYLREHFFDNIDMNDPRILRSPFFFPKVDFYVQKYHIQHPDTISLAIDKVLKKLEGNPETFRYYLSHFLNSYLSSKLVGMDAVFVHLVDNYYLKEKAPWLSEEQMKNILTQANKVRPVLIGKKAPNFTVTKMNGEKLTLYEEESEYTILYFWSNTCGFCKKSTPVMQDFYEKYKDKGVKIIAVCMKYTDEVAPCWEYVKEKEIDNWIHTADPYRRMKLDKLYDAETTPTIYVLDKDKIIRSKKIGADQLEEVMDNIIKMREMDVA